MLVLITTYGHPFEYCAEWETKLKVIPRVGDCIAVGDDGPYYNETGTHYYHEMRVRKVIWDYCLHKLEAEEDSHHVLIICDAVWEYDE